MMRRRLLGLAQLGLVAAVVLHSASCARRERRAIQQPGASGPVVPAGPGVPTAVPVPTGVVAPTGPTPSGNVLPPVEIDTSSGPTGATGATGPTGAPGPTGATGPTGVPSGGDGATAMNISTQLEDGTAASITWDGKTFKGNDKYDVVPQ